MNALKMEMKNENGNGGEKSKCGTKNENGNGKFDENKDLRCILVHYYS